MKVMIERSIDVQLRRGDEDHVLARSLAVEGLTGRDQVDVAGRRFHRLQLRPLVVAPGSTVESWARGTLPRSRALVDIVIAAGDGSVLGRYCFVVERWASRSSGDGVGVELLGELQAVALPHVASLWSEWADGLPALGAWQHLDFDHRMAWLEIARHRHHRPPGAARRAVTAHVDGAMATDYPGFFCALGEALLGAGGYVGADLDGLADSLTELQQWYPDLRLVWHGAAQSRRLLDADAIDRAVDYRRRAAPGLEQRNEEMAPVPADQGGHETLFAVALGLLSNSGVSVILIDD